MSCPDSRTRLESRCTALPGGAVLAVFLLASIGCGAGATPQPAKPPRLARELHPAATALEERRFDAARELAQAFLDTHPGDGQAMSLLGLSYYWTDNHGAARPWLEQALARAPELTFVHEFLGRSLFLLGDLEAARSEHEAWLAVAPDEPKGHYGLGLIELEETRLEAAAVRFRRAIELFAALEQRDPRQVATRQPELAECHARLGEVHFARGEHEAARAELLRATSIAPGNISAFYTLSLVHRRLGEEQLADRAAERHESARRALLASQEARAE